MADAGTRIVSLTVTEGGYNLDAVTGEFDASDPRCWPTCGRTPRRAPFSGW
jgi:Mannitol-1-phosphate/altronate dehydrogenases